MKENSIYIKSFLWNMLGGLLNAGQSFVLILVITWAIGIESAGFFSFAFALANQFLSIGQYGMRNYQVTDSRAKYKFLTYLYSRYVTTAIMLIMLVAYCVGMMLGDKYSIENVISLFMLGIWKVIDSLDDVFQGLYQQKGRLDVGAFWFSVRTGVSLVLFCVTVIFSKSIVNAISIAASFNLLCLPLAVAKGYPSFRVTNQTTNFNEVKNLMRDVFPLFLSTFTSSYILSAPKYAIEAEMNSTMQAVYGYISMPVMFISLISSFFLQPLLSRMAIFYNEGKRREFFNVIFRQILLVVILGIMILICGFYLGIPVLSMLYNVELVMYKGEFMLLLISGVFTFFASGLLYNILVIMRCTKVIVTTYVVLAAVMFVVSRSFVKYGGLMGASIVVLSIAIIMSIVFIINIAKTTNKKEWT